MTAVRKTISLPPTIVEDVEAEAAERGMSFSAVVAERLARRGRKLSITGIIAAEPDLSLRIEEILQRAFRDE
jgi:hypothetical protein